MIGKIIKGKNFKCCVSYVLGKENSKLLDGEGVLLNDTQSIINSLYMQSLMNPKLAKSVGHIPLSYSKEDEPKLTDELMVKLAKEYMQAMKIENTQYIIVRHHDKAHPHCHIVFNRIDNNGKTISDKNDHFRNEQVTKALKEKYGLTLGESKQQVNTNRLQEPDKTKFEIHAAIKSVLKSAKNWQQFKEALSKQGVELKFKFKGQTDEVQGISFTKGDYSFKGSEVDRSFSFSKLDTVLNGNEQSISEIQTKQIQTQDNNWNIQTLGETVTDIASGIGSLLPDISTNPNPDEEYNPFKYPKKKKNPKQIKR